MSPAAGAGLTAQAVADLVGGRLLGDGGVVLRGVRPLDQAGPDTLSLAVARRYAAALRASRAGAVLVPETLADVADIMDAPQTKILVRDTSKALLRVLTALYPATCEAPGIDPSVRLGAGVVLGEDVSIGPFTALGRGVRVGARCRISDRVSLGDGVVVGEDTVIHPGVVCYPGTTIGSRVVLKANAVVGGPGFGFVWDGAAHQPIPHVGGCTVEDDVQIGSGSCIDRGSIDDTIVGHGTKIDNMVHVAHNVRIGARCLLMAGSGLAGSVRMGNDVILAGHTGVIDHIEIGDRARIGAKSAVFGNVAAGTTISGHPARSHRQYLRAQGALYRLAPIVDQLEQLVENRANA